MKQLLLASALVALPAAAASLDELGRQTAALNAGVRALDTRLEKLESGAAQSPQLLNLLRDVEQLRADLARLRGDAELQAHQIDTLAKRQTDLYTDLDQRLIELGKKVAQPAPAAPVEAASPPDPARGADEARTYDAALAQFRAGNYNGALSGFREFLERHPQSALTANAQYWIGHSYYALKDYKNAAAQQRKLVELYPASTKAPDAMLNLATNQVHLDDLAGAKKTLETLIATYPSSNAATLAKRRLDALK